VWFLCKTYKKTPDDPFIADMDPVQKIWMFENWLADQNDEAELAKNHAYLLASFDHPESVQKLLGNNNTHQSTDEEFEETSRMIKEMNKDIIQPTEHRARRRRTIKD